MDKTSHHHTHSHAHHHAHAAPLLMPAFSLLRLSVPQRLMLSFLQIGVMWGLLLWALAE